MEISKEGFKTTTGADGCMTLLFDTDKPKECCEYLIKNNIKKVSIYPGIYKASDLKPLLSIKDYLEGVLLNEKIDSSLLFHFEKLKFISAPDNKKDIIDLNKFSKLETLCCNISNRILGLENCKNLTTLFINNFNPKEKDLSSLPNINSLKYLAIFQSNVTNLNGIGNFKNINKLQLYSCSKLVAIDQLNVYLNSLEEIEIDHCKKITDFEILGELKTLKKIIISESGEIKSLAFVKLLTKLELISFWGTNVLDGNIEYCKGINYVGYDNKKHYNIKVETFKNK